MTRYPISGRVRRDLAGLETKLRRTILATTKEIAEPTFLAMQAGGKRLRPALVLLCAMMGEYDKRFVADGAMAVELVHLASLIHDDVLDGAETRRGEPTVNARFGLKTALATGDYLFGLAFQLLADYGDGEVIKPLARASVALSFGELLQKETAHDPGQGYDSYLQKINCKTASLFGAACEIGSILGGIDMPTRQALAAYGENLGLAFQIYDDVLDITGDESLLGKPTGTDFRDGTLTLPIIFALEEDGDSPLRALVRAQGLTQVQVAQAVGLVSETAIDRAKVAAKGYVDASIRAIADISDDQVKRDLSSLARFVVDRYN